MDAQIKGKILTSKQYTGKVILGEKEAAKEQGKKEQNLQASSLAVEPQLENSPEEQHDNNTHLKVEGGNLSYNLS